MVKKPDQEVMDLIKATAAQDPQAAYAALYELAQAIQTPLRDAVLSGNVAGGIFETVKLEP